ncbi:MAG TPA: sigma-70 family RNA polymerase sigma factor [Gemmatimonadaceae bacterium]|nr:sigma-70 family RNA polymerase sigma factor [Gemmatimonadaceae bacterium]
MSSPLPEAEVRRIYLDALERAVRHAALHVPRSEALEVGHHVATALVHRLSRETGDAMIGTGPVQDVDAFVHRSVLNRLREVWRGNKRRTAVEESYEAERCAVAPAWSRPDSNLDSRELHRVIETAVAALPDAQRQVFLLVRRDQCSYKEVAARLGIAVGTVHTHLSRANASLREAMADFHGSRPVRSVGRKTIGTGT